MKTARHGTPDLSDAKWRSSTYSGGNNECLELAHGVPAFAPVRDSKCPAGPVIRFSRDAWRAFLAHLG
ncbi:hypothetical protein STXM2123_1861 [Streptomyces sp. F-3]|uniref:DUF397 domain-containing protein n=1 Tax=Streptomyces TaxID=1883 RepID=UPI0007C3DE4D|nr:MULTISPECIES: DUF397 domain-containing protein [Streptomyces]MDN5383574.1 DUF397 domain-containing protein [Streptomyces sp. LB8]GAT81160.1 hypothetical protein STXM2123_1861 [Streptomyces sp. F-3]